MAERDHLAALMFEGGGVSHGSYTPERVTLALSGRDELADHVVYLHEVHHRGLNDSTAWGAALQILAELPAPQRSCVLPLLDACRLPHEAFATFASVNVAGARHVDAAAVLDAYPAYVQLYSGLARLVSVTPGPHRQYLLATALARVSMQTPILAVLLASPDFTVTPPELRAIDTPNGRWRWFLGHGSELLERAATQADMALANRSLICRDDGRHDDIAEPPNDGHWERWEKSAYAIVSDGLRDVGAEPLDYNGHMEHSQAAVARALKLAPGLRLRAATITDPAPDDRSLASATTERVRLTLSTEPYRSRLVSLDVRRLVEEVDEQCRIADRPGLVLSARFPSRLASSYEWGAEDRRTLAARAEPLVAARVIEGQQGAGLRSPI
jgi:hypothetical protein